MKKKECLSCPEAYRVGWGSRVIFCNGERGDVIDSYRERGDILREFLELYPNHSCSKRKPLSLRKESRPESKAIFPSPYYKQASFLYLMLNHRCNNDCRFCYLGNKKKTANRPFPEIKKIIEEAPEKKITLFGGEPTINPFFFTIVDLLQRKGKKIKMTTNARKFSERTFTSRFFVQDFEQITVSLHSFKKKEHEYLTNSPGFTETVRGIQNIARYKKNKTRIRANIVIHKRNYKDLRRIVQFAAELGVNTIRLNGLGVSMVKNAAYNRELAVDPGLTIPFISDAVEYLRAKQKNIRCYVSNHPFCYFPQIFWPFLSNRRLTLEKHSDELALYPQGTLSATLSAACADCVVKEHCPGFYYSSLLCFNKSIDAKLKPISEQEKNNFLETHKFRP